jgi:3-isopropylmalate/(R)-2-methylmalate dehydratase small subunit
MNKVISGTAFVYGNNIDTDQIYPGRFLSETDLQDVAHHAMAGIDENFLKEFHPGDLIIAGTNFGCGSSREHAAITLKAIQIGGVVAESFARIFFRNAINLGIPLVVCLGIRKHVSRYDKITIDMDTATLKNEMTGKTFACEPLSNYMMRILEAGGIKPMLRAQYGQKNS